MLNTGQHGRKLTYLRGRKEQRKGEERRRGRAELESTVGRQDSTRFDKCSFPPAPVLVEISAFTSKAIHASLFYHPTANQTRPYHGGRTLLPPIPSPQWAQDNYTPA